jgi:hypothetical protein
MSMSPEDQIVGSISRWLARHIDDAELLDEIENVPADGLPVDELIEELRAPGVQRGQLEMIARETLEALALD